MPSNEDRADWALTALNAFAAETGQTADIGGGDDDIASVIGDLLCDLGHLCDRHGIDFHSKVVNAVATHASEKLPGMEDHLGPEPAVTLEIGWREGEAYAWTQAAERGAVGSLSDARQDTP